MPKLITINVNRVTNKFINKATCVSFPLVGNPSFKERLRTSRNDKNGHNDVVILMNSLVHTQYLAS